MPDQACVHCGQDGFLNRHARDYHVRRCAENKNPTCPKCGLHFVYARLPDHKKNCGFWKERTGKEHEADASADAPAADASAAKPAEGAGLLGVPPERLTDTDKEIVQLLAPPDEKPAPPPAAPEPEAEKTAQAARADVEAAQDDDAEREGGLAGRFSEREPPRTLALASLGDSLKRNWFLLAIIAAILAALILWRVLSKQEAQQAASVQAATPPPMQYRPAYNPETHGSLEQFRAAFGHLPTQGGA